MGDLKDELKKMDVALVKGYYFSNAYNQEAIRKREDFLTAVKEAGVSFVFHNDMSDTRLSEADKENMMATYPYLTEDDFKADGQSFTLDREEYVFGVGPITVRFVEFGE